MLFSPSSPRWLFLAGKRLAALKVLSQIRKPEQIAKESKAIEDNLLIKHGGWRDVFSKKVRPVLIIGLVLGIGQQFVGSNTVFYYGPVIFAKVGFKGAYAQILGTFGLGVVNTIFTIFTIMTVDRWGRRTLLVSGTLAAAISLAALGLLLNGTDTTWSIYSSVFCLVTYVAGYAISLGALLWLIIAEIFPLNIRGLSMSFVAGIQWGANFIVASTFLTVLQGVGSRYTFWLYGFMSLLACLFCYFYVPETKGVSLEDIEKNLELGKPSRELGRPAEKGYI